MQDVTKKSTTHRRLIRAVHTDRTVRVYQAYNDKIADAVVQAQSFVAASDAGLWSTQRMTWIKPSKVWMAYRCGWTVFKDKNQARVLALDLDRTKFEELLAQGTITTHCAADGEGKRCRSSSVVVQWDPERVIHRDASPDQVFTKKLPGERSIQIGLRPPANEALLDPQVVVRITDVTSHFRAALSAMKQGGADTCSDDVVAGLFWPDGETETPLPMPEHIQTNLKMTRMTTALDKKKDAVVVLGCTANPPHQGHLHCLNAAETKAEHLGYNVIFATIAVAPSGYVRNKMKKAKDDNSNVLLLDDDTRLRVLETMTDKTSAFLLPTRTYGSALECGRALRPSDNATVIVVVGGDRFKWTKPSHPDLVTLCCARSEEQMSRLQTELSQALDEGLVVEPSKWQLMASVGPPTSSTLVRSILTNSETGLEQKEDALRQNGYSEEATKVLLQNITKTQN